MSLKKDFKLLLRPYYFLNILISFSYILLKRTPYICDYVFTNFPEKCEIDSLRVIGAISWSVRMCAWALLVLQGFLKSPAKIRRLEGNQRRETEILFFLMIVVAMRTRKTGSTTMLSYLSSSFMYAKVANAILYFYADMMYGLLFVLVLIVCAVLFPELTYSGPENITYFRGLQGLDDELARDKKISWVVTFYTMWSPSCNNLAPIFANLSADYHTEKLRFGKVDVGRWPEAAKKYRINDGSTSKQLPTIILFQNGKEVTRRPEGDANGKLQKFFFSADNIRVAFDLNNIYEQSKKKEAPAVVAATNAGAKKRQ